MEILLLLIAFLVMLAAGYGIIFLIVTRTQAINILELFSLSFLVGVTAVSLISFVAGFFLSGLALRLLVSIASLSLGLAGAKRKLRVKIDLAPIAPSKLITTLLIGILALQAIYVARLCFSAHVTGDGIVIWDSKARIAQLNGGAIPLEYYSDIPYARPEYPLLLPLTKAWFYGWLGRTDQGLGKLISIPFYIAALILLYAGGSRLSNQSWRGLIPIALVPFVPIIIGYAGSPISSYADFPLAVFYLGAIIYLIDYWKTMADGSLHLFGCLAVALPWIKQEGSLLWLLLVALAAIKVIQNRRIKMFLCWMMPSAIVFVGWNLFIRLAKTPVGSDFLPFTPTSLWMNLGRGHQIAQAVANQWTQWWFWGLLWPGMILSMPLFILKSPRKQPIALLLTVISPVILYSGIYFFSSWADFAGHIASSIDRLFLQISLVAVLILGLAAPFDALSSFASNKRVPAQSIDQMELAE